MNRYFVVDIPGIGTVNANYYCYETHEPSNTHRSFEYGKLLARALDTDLRVRFMASDAEYPVASYMVEEELVGQVFRARYPQGVLWIMFSKVFVDSVFIVFP